jgi:hypothetical protein
LPILPVACGPWQLLHGVGPGDWGDGVCVCDAPQQFSGVWFPQASEHAAVGEQGHLLLFPWRCPTPVLSLDSRNRRGLACSFALVAHISVGAAALLSLLLGVGGFLAFGGTTKGLATRRPKLCACFHRGRLGFIGSGWARADDVLDNFKSNNVPANVARFFFALAIMVRPAGQEKSCSGWDRNLRNDRSCRGVLGGGVTGVLCAAHVPD